MFFGRKAKDKDAKDATNGIGASPVTQAAPSAKPAAPAIGNSVAPRELEDEEAKRRVAAARHASATFGEIVTLLMRTPEYKDVSLGDLEALVVPPLLSGQVSVATAQSQNSGVTMPVGAILWARVSPEVAKRLASQAGHTIRLAPEEWKSGEIIWVVASAGEGRVLSEMLKQLSKREWAGKDVRIVVRPKNGVPTVATLAIQSSQAA
jgi:hemolysin-activating ACP:hemolysin acyltransferase